MVFSLAEDCGKPLSQFKFIVLMSFQQVTLDRDSSSLNEKFETHWRVCMLDDNRAKQCPLCLFWCIPHRIASCSSVHWCQVFYFVLFL